MLGNQHPETQWCKIRIYFVRDSVGQLDLAGLAHTLTVT